MFYLFEVLSPTHSLGPSPQKWIQKKLFVDWLLLLWFSLDESPEHQNAILLIQGCITIVKAGFRSSILKFDVIFATLAHGHLTKLYCIHTMDQALCYESEIQGKTKPNLMST